MKSLFIIIFFIGTCNVLIAQSDNYWSWNFNTPSTLLAGSVVGGSAGPSAIFYNPSLIDHEKVPSVSLSANIISLQFFNASNIAGDEINAKEFFFKIQQALEGTKQNNAKVKINEIEKFFGLSVDLTSK